MMYIRSTCGKAHVVSPFVSYTRIRTGPFFLLRDLELHAHWPHRYHCIIIKLENPRIICHLYLLDARVNLDEQIIEVEEVENF